MWEELTPESRQIAIYMCHNAGFPAKEIGKSCGLSKRHVNRLIAAFPTSFPSISHAVQVFNNFVTEKGQCESRATGQLETGPLVSMSFNLCPQCAGHDGRQAASLALLKSKLRKSKVHIARLQTLVAQLKQATNEDTTPGCSSGEEQDPSIVDEMMRLYSLNPYARRYSEKMFRMSYCLMVTSSCAYRFARRILPLPCKSQIYDRFSSSVHEMKKNLTKLKHTHRLLEAFVAGRPPGMERTACTLGVDAFAFRLFLRKIATLAEIRKGLTKAELNKLGPILEDKEILSLIREDDDVLEELSDESLLENVEPSADDVSKFFKSYTSCFIFVLMPLNNDMPCVTLHLEPAEHGAANETVMDTLERLIEICGEYKVDIPYISADGDKGWNKKFKDTFKVMEEVRESHLCDFALDVYQECERAGKPLAVTDLLHYLKAARGRYIDRRIAVTSADWNAATDPDRVNQILGLNLVISDKSQIGRMRDFYPVELFTIHNVRILLQNNVFPDAFYLLPHALLLLVIRVPFFTITFRLQLLNVAYCLFREVYLDVKKGVPKDQTEDTVPKVGQRRSDSVDLLTWAEVGTLRRILCTIIAYASAFQLHPYNLRTDALGTHIVEGKIGQARRDCDTRWERILATFAKTSLRTIFQEMENIDLGIPGRLKTAGCRLYEESGNWEISDFDDALFSQVVFHSCTEAGRAASDFPRYWERVFNWIVQIDDVVKERSSEIGRLWLPNPAANSAIMARLLKSKASDYGVGDPYTSRKITSL